ncbi:MAG: multifunctional SOS repair factor [Parcubacteria group bacterium Greene1014_20]|nr:MAG: multifunctional SOS repair factor [Parcubacteria group bacterium Greene1014_20]
MSDTISVNKEKLKAAGVAMEQIRGRFGDGSIMKLGEWKKVSMDVIPTGCLSLDIALGVGGIPRGRVVEVFGPESSGKTTMALHMVAEVQKLGGIAAFVDAEHALDPEYARKIGVNIDDMLVSQPDSGEQALEIVETLVRSNAVDVIVVDSVADQHMGLQARLMSQALRKLTAIIGKTQTVVIFINQIRMKIGVFFGNPETTTGGNALKFYSSVRIEVRRAAQLKLGDVIIGNRTKIKVVKNKVAPPFRVAEFDIIFNEGVSKSGDILEAGAIYKVVNKAGNTYSYRDQKLGVGKENAKKALSENLTLMETIRKEILETFLAGGKGETPAEDGEVETPPEKSPEAEG